MVERMTNREYLATLSNEELSATIYQLILPKIGRRYNDAELGVAKWLGQQYDEKDYHYWWIDGETHKIVTGKPVVWMRYDENEG